MKKRKSVERLLGNIILTLLACIWVIQRAFKQRLVLNTQNRTE